jgi:hypothetical protein
MPGTGCSLPRKEPRKAAVETDNLGFQLISDD